MKEAKKKIDKPAKPEKIAPVKKVAPPPSKSLLALDIGTRTTKMVCGKWKGSKISIDVLAGAVNEPGIIEDGKITNVQKIQQTLKGMILTNKPTTKLGVCTVDSTEFIRREMDIPSVTDADVLSLVSYEIGQYLPIDTSSYVLQVKNVESYQEYGSKKMKVSVGALPKNIIEKYISVMDVVGIGKEALDVHSNSIEKLINVEIEASGGRRFADKNIAFIDMGHSYFNISIFGNGRYLFNKLIEIGGFMIDEAVAAALGVSVFDAEKMKLQNSGKATVIDLIKYFSSGATPSNEEEKAMFQTLSVCDQWANEIAQVIKYYLTRDRSNKIDEVYLFGGGSFIEGIEYFFEKKIQLPVRKEFQFDCIDLKGQGANPNILNYLNAIGALIRR